MAASLTGTTNLVTHHVHSSGHCVGLGHLAVRAMAEGQLAFKGLVGHAIADLAQEPRQQRLPQGHPGAIIQGVW